MLVWWPRALQVAKRKDFREICPRICSIDPPGCTDIDDALHCRTLPNGNIEVGVHIADVTHFLKPESQLDDEALERGTTVYLVDRRIEMLPGLLTADLCSLRSDVDRLAFSTTWELDPETLEVVDTAFHRSIIKSCKSFTYGPSAQPAETQRNASWSAARALLNAAVVHWARSIAAVQP